MSGPRDPARVERILDLLRQVWTKPGNRDMRLAQLVVNIIPDGGRLTVGQVYNFEDDLLEAKLAGVVQHGWAGPPPAEPPAAPVCATCNDTHRMANDWPCTRCPTPCKACQHYRGGGYCQKTPCYCTCHHPKPQETR